MATTLRPIRPEDRLSLVEHLDELRKRLIICVAVFLAAFGVCLWQGDVVLDIINRPLEKTAFKNDPKETKDPFERTAAFQAQVKRSATVVRGDFRAAWRPRARTRPRSRPTRIWPPRTGGSRSPSPRVRRASR